MTISGDKIRSTVLEVIKELSRGNSSQFQSASVLREVWSRLGLHQDIELEQAVLTFFHDLFRNGYIAWGYNIQNPDPPFCHLTEQGRKVLSNISRDPANPDGYLQYLAEQGNLNEIAKSYIKEALITFNLSAYKSSAVMVGCAVESTILEIRERVIDRLEELKIVIPKKLNDWKIKTVTDQIYKILLNSSSEMGHSLQEAYEVYWPAMVHQIRISRNNAGHPVDLESITFESVHSSLLIFPEIVSFTNEIVKWIEEADLKNT